MVRVRRESDNTEKDFTAGAVASGSMARWVNEQPTLPLDLRELDTNTGERDGALIEAAAAYSLRKLKEDFTGDVVEVRRSSDDAVQAFTASEVADGTLEDWVTADDTQYMRFEYTHGSEKYVNLGAFPNATNATITFKCLFPNDSTTYRTFVGASDVGSDYVGLFDEGSTSTTLSFGAGSPVIKVDGSTGWGTTRGDLFDAVVDNQIHTIEITAANISTWTDLSLGVYGGSGESGSGIIWDVTVDETGDSTVDHSYNGYGITDADWVDQTGSKDGTVNGSPTSTLLNDGYVRRWYDQSGNTNDATQTDPTKQPKIVDGGELLTDSRNNPAIVFDDVNDNMDLTSDLATGGAYSAIAYHEFSSPSMILKGNLNVPKIRLTSATNYDIGSYSPTVDQDFTVASTLGLVSVLKDASHNARVYSNGTESSSGQQNIGSGSVPFTMLGTEISDGAANGKLVEVIYYESDQTDNRTAIEANIGETYGITAIPAANDTVNGYVHTWYDQSGSGNDAAQTTASSQPKIVDGGSLVTGGIDFDGVDDSFTLTSGLTINPSTSGFSSFIATKFDKAATGSAQTFLRNSNLNPKHVINFNTNGTYRYILNDGTNNLFADTGFDYGDDSVTLFSTIITGQSATGLTHFVDGSQDGQFDTSLMGDTGTVADTISWPAFPFGGVVQEFIVYESNQSANRPAIEANIANQYGITLS